MSLHDGADFVRIKEIQLMTQRLEASLAFDRAVLLEERTPLSMGEIHYRLVAKLARLPEKRFIRMERPATWRDHFWLDVGKWMRRRGPKWFRELGRQHVEAARMIVEEHDAVLLFPDVEIPPHGPARLTIAVFDGPNARR